MREVEAAIGYDCRRLEDGRRALFRHTFLHKRARRDFLERRDIILALGASYVANAAFSANFRFDLDVSTEVISSCRGSLMKSMFPYLSIKEKAKVDKYEDYLEYFDELDAIEEQAKASGALAGESPNDIMDKAQ